MKALRSAVAGSKFSVERRDNALALIAPADTSFNAKRHELLLPNTLGPLSKVAKLVQDDPQSGVVVLGHSDSSGNKADNDKLSLQRAQAVAAIFHLSGLGNDRLRFKGVGGDQPRADNKTAKGRALNRRVEVLLTSRGNLLALAQSNKPARRLSPVKHWDACCVVSARVGEFQWPRPWPTCAVNTPVTDSARRTRPLSRSVCSNNGSKRR
jgi:hypothetical protein